MAKDTGIPRSRPDSETDSEGPTAQGARDSRGSDSESRGPVPPSESAPSESSSESSSSSARDSAQGARSSSSNPSDEVVESLRRRKGESNREHRALLLFAMQMRSERSLRATSRAVGRSESTVRGWRERHRWRERMEALGRKPVLAERRAAQAYRALYYPALRLREIVEIEDRLRTPFEPEAVVEETIRDEVRDLLRKEKRGSKVEAEKSKREKERRRHLALVDGALGLVAKRIASGEIRANLRDIPTLLDIRGKILAESSSEGGPVGIAVESARVRMARANGTDVIAALIEDAKELTAVLEAIRAPSQIPEELRTGVSSNASEDA